MYGAILGDIIGSPYEFDRDKEKTADKQFPLFREDSEFTDDTVMTVAVVEGLMAGLGDEEKSRLEVIKSMTKWGIKYPDAGYGGRFAGWLYLQSSGHEAGPYNSFGNGSAMRVSGAGWLYNSLDEAELFAKISAEVTHNHPEGIKGAQAVAGAIYLARTGSTKKEIKEYIEDRYQYDLDRTIDEIRPVYCHNESCQKTVPEAIIAFIEGSSFEDVIRTAVSLGGDADTLGAIAGSIAEAYYGVPDDLKKEALKRIPDEMIDVLEDYEHNIK